MDDRSGHGGSLGRRIVPEDPRRIGEEPDYRFTLANERTFLAWIRTALALAAGGLGAIGLLTEELAGAEALGLGLLAMSFIVAASAYRRWALQETSMRLGQPLPPSRLPGIMAAATAIVAFAAAVLFVVDQL
ncbi:MAG: DUF202 domain-containing protein [Actinomycetota bacterium]